MSANVKRAMAITVTLNRLTFNDADEVRALFSELIGKKVDDSFLLLPPFYTAAVSISVWGAVCSSIRTAPSTTLAASTFADDVMIGPNVSIITTGFRQLSLSGRG